MTQVYGFDKGVVDICRNLCHYDTFIDLKVLILFRNFAAKMLRERVKQREPTYLNDWPSRAGRKFWRAAMTLALTLLTTSAVWADDELVLLTGPDYFTVTDGTAGKNDAEGPASLLDGKYTSDNHSKWCTYFVNYDPIAD